MSMTDASDPLSKDTSSLSIDGKLSVPTKNALEDALGSSQDSIQPINTLEGRRTSVLSISESEPPRKYRIRSPAPATTAQSSGEEPPKKNKKTRKRTPAIKFTSKFNKKIHIKDFRRILLHSLSKSSGDVCPIEIKNGKFVNKFVIFHIPGLYPEDFNVPYSESHLPIETSNILSELQFFRDNFQFIYPTIHPGRKDSLFPIISTLINQPLSLKEREKILKYLRQMKLHVDDLVLTKKELLADDYPLHSKIEQGDRGSSKFLETKDLNHSETNIYSIDCEFCRSIDEEVLTRISVINYQEEVVLDTYVKPDVPIVDYVTKYSGITEESLVDVTTKLEDVQEQILSIVSCDDILVGHSLHSDLKVLKISHPRIIDTSVIYDHNRGPPAKPALRILAKKHLDISIQQGEDNGTGHSSVEDAIACLKLLKLKLLKGLLFGKVLDDQTIFQIINNDSDEVVQSSIIDYCSTRYYCNDETGSRYHITRIRAENDDQIIDTVINDCVGDTKIVISKLSELDFNSGEQVPDQYNGHLRDERDTPMTTEERGVLLKRLNERLTKVYEKLPSSSVLMILSGTSDASRIRELEDIKMSYERAEKNGETVSADKIWDFDKQIELLEIRVRMREMCSFIGVKQ